MTLSGLWEPGGVADAEQDDHDILGYRELF
jgi:hypothetical protein